MMFSTVRKWREGPDSQLGRVCLGTKTILGLKSMAWHCLSNGDGKSRMSYGLAATANPTLSWQRTYRLYRVTCFYMCTLPADTKSHGPTLSLT
jgi:hypothetical protein